MSAAEHLAQYGVSFQQARDFIHSNLNSPQVIYNVAAQYGVTFEMLGELYADGVSDITVKNFFAAQGFNTTTSVPTLPTTPTTPDTPEEPTVSIPTPVESLTPEAVLDNVLVIPSDGQAYDWDTLISDYQAALASIDWNGWSTTLESALADFDWDTWAAEMQQYANAFATDDSWISDLEDLFGDSNLEGLFDNGMAWPDTGDDLNSTLDDINWDDYAGYLAQFGITEEQIGNLLTQAFNAVDWDAIMDQLANFDWQGYADMLAGTDWSGYMQGLEGLYNNTDFTNSLEILGTATAMPADFALS